LPIGLSLPLVFYPRPKTVLLTYYYFLFFLIKGIIRLINLLNEIRFCFLNNFKCTHFNNFFQMIKWNFKHNNHLNSIYYYKKLNTKYSRLIRFNLN
jgi:hypothetical protein